MNESDFDEWEAPPPKNATPPTPFELASLAATYQVAGKSEKESFDAAIRTFQKAEERLEFFETQSVREKVQVHSLFKNLIEESRKMVEPTLKKIGCPIPDENSFPLRGEEFHERLCPQLNIEDRRKHLERLTELAGQKTRGPLEIRKIEGWLKLVEALIEDKKLSESEGLKDYLEKLTRPQRGTKREFKLRRASTKKDEQKS